MATGDRMPDGPERKPTRRGRRVVLSILAGLVVLLGVLFTLAPTLAGWFGRGAVERAINKGIAGTALVGQLSLSWSGPQEAREVTLLDPAGGQVGTLTVRSTAGLWGLLTGGRDLGMVQVTGGADLVVDADGRTNLERAVAPRAAAVPTAPPGGSGPSTMRLPAGIAGTVEIRGFEIAYTDPRLSLPGQERGGTIVLPHVNGKASFGAGKPVEGFLAFEALSGSSRADANNQVGSVEAQWTASGLIDAQGNLTPSSAMVEATVEFKDLSVPVADALLAQHGRLEAMMGHTLGAKLTATGAGSDLRVDLLAASPRTSLDVGLRYTPTAVESVRAGTVKLDTAGLKVLAPDVFTDAPAAGGGTLAVDQWPSAVLSVEALRLPMAGASPDWAAASGKVTIRAGDAAGRIAVGGDDGGPRVIVVKMKPLTAVVESQGLASGVHLSASDALEVDGHRAGDLSIDLSISNLVTPGAAGAPAAIDPGRAMLDGAATLSEFDTRAAQPFVQALGVRLPQDVGPEVDIELTAAGRIDPGSSLPETTVELRITGAVAMATAEVEVENGAARTTGDGIKVESKNAGPLVSRLASASGVRIQGPMPVRLSATDVRIDLVRALRRSAGSPGLPSAALGPDLRGAGGVLALWIGQASGTAPLTPDGAARPFRLSETTLTIDSTNFAQGMNLRTMVQAAIDGAPAGILDVSVAALGVLDETGGARSVPAGPFRGRISARGVPTSLIQALVPALAAARIDLPADLGPSFDVSLAAKPGEAAPAGSVAPTNFELTLKGEKFDASGSAVVDRAGLRSGATPFSATLQSPGPLLTRWLPDGVKAGGSGAATLTVSDFSMSLGSVDPLAATGKAELGLQALSLKPASGDAVDIESTRLSVRAPANGPVSVGVNGSFRQGGKPFGVFGDVRLDGLIGTGPAGRRVLTATALRPVGSIKVEDAPPSLAAFAPGAKASGAGGEPVGAVGLVELLQATLGPGIDVDLSMAAAPGGGGTDARLSAGSTGAHLDLAARISAKEVVLKDSTGDFMLTVDSVAALLNRFAPGQEADLALRAPAKLGFTLAGAKIPLGADGLPTLAGAAPLRFGASIPGKLEFENLGQVAGVGAGDGPKGFADLKASGSLPLAALAAGGAGDATADLTAAVLGGPAGAPQRLQGAFSAHLESGSPRGPMSVDFKVHGLDTRWADAAAGSPGLVSGLLGDAADVDASFDARFDPGSTAEAPAVLRDGALDIGVSSPIFSMSVPATVRIHEDRFELLKPTVVKATLAPEWANRFILAQPSAADGPPEPSTASFSAPTAASINLTRLVVARGPGPMKPGVFALRAAVDSPRIAMILGDGPAEFVGLSIDATGGQKPGVIGFSMRMAERGTDGAKSSDDTAEAPLSGAVRFAGGLYGVCDDQGRPTFDAARITATGRAPGFKTAVLDAMAGRDGLLIDLLGPRVSLDVDLGGFGRESGKVAVQATSPRANASIKGTVQHGVLVASEPATVEVNEVTKELGARLTQGLPLIGVFEKRPEDGPATVKATGLRVPMNHDLTQFDADFLFDFGVARFQAGGAFSSILKAVGGKESGEVGRKLAPLNIAVRSGVISYDRYTLPLGEFAVQTKGTVDLVNRRIDFITYIPLGALTDEAAGLFNTGLGSLIGSAVPIFEQATMVPWRTSGPMDNPRTTPEVGLFLENAGQSLLSPGENVVDRLRDLFGPGKK